MIARTLGSVGYSGPVAFAIIAFVDSKECRRGEHPNITKRTTPPQHRVRRYQQLAPCHHCRPLLYLGGSNAWSSDFIKCVREGSRNVYYGEADDQSVSEHYPLRSGNKSQPKESHFNDIMGVCALLKKHSSSVGKKSRKVFMLRISLVTKALHSMEDSVSL